MVTTLVLRRVVEATWGRAGKAGALAGRSTAVAGRNLVAARHAAYWWVLVSGFFEPVLYLLSIGVGVGGLVGDFTLSGGVTISYAAFVAPAMLAASAMNGAFVETSMNFFGKMRYAKLFDSVIATPVSPFEIALGELGWALVRGSAYSVAFLGIMIGMGLTTPGMALAAFPATILVGVAFGGLGMLLATCLRSWQDFDYLNILIFAQFLFSGTFAPAGEYPLGLRILVEIMPLIHAVELIRGLTTGLVSWRLVLDTGFLVALAWAGLAAAARRTGRALCR